MRSGRSRWLLDCIADLHSMFFPSDASSISMVLPTRWIVVDDQRMPVGHVAARTLRRRLEAVWLELPHAGNCSDLTPDRVHRIRVATRRGLVALDAFRTLLSSSRCAWFEKRLRRIRHAAGEARDLDVLADRLSNDSSNTTTIATPSEDKIQSLAARTARNRLVAMLARQRDVSRQPIHSISQKLRDDDWPGQLERLLDDIPQSHKQMRFGDYARQRFKPMIKRFFSAANRKLRHADEMHALRIEGKRLRYAMELFAGVFAPRTRARCYDSLEQLQKMLGNFTDHAAAADRLGRWANDRSALPLRQILVELHREEVAMADESRMLFVKWWRPSRRRTLRQRFDLALEEPSFSRSA